MNFKKLILGLAAVGIVSCALAQEYPANWTRTIVLAAPQTLVTANATNGPIDKIGGIGQGYIDIFSLTNASGNIETAQIYTSPDQTNLTALANYALISSATTITVTNFLYGGTNGLTASNPVLLPGTITTPTAATAGSATPYLAPLAYTNTGAITISAKGTYRVLMNNLQDANRYFYIVYVGSGTSTNITVGANLTIPIMRQ